MDATEHLLDLDLDEGRARLAEWLAARNQPRYRARQILEQVYRRGIGDPERMADLPRPLRDELASSVLSARLAEESRQISADGTQKYRFQLADSKRIEAVWIPSGERGTLCISSQAGCPARCSFCATGAGGFFRNLSAAEILGQWLWVRQRLRAEGAGDVSQIVFMGMGEPLLNYRAVALALRHFVAGFAFSPRRITVSTVGVPREMERLVSEFPQVRLALSLHSAVNRTRDRIVPWNRRHPVEKLRAALLAIAPDHRRISLEYVLLAAVNDGAEEARALARFATGCAGHINLLPFHPFPGAPHEALSRREMLRFRSRVEEDFRGVVTIRRSRGLDIAGACGQLALIDAEAARAASERPD